MSDKSPMSAPPAEVDHPQSPSSNICQTPSFWQAQSMASWGAGLVAVLVGYASSVAIVLQAAQASDADTVWLNSWLLVLGLSLGLSCIFLSLRFRMPILTAWSTPGAALLAVSLVGYGPEAAVGAFLCSACLTLLLGITGWSDRLMALIPAPLASAMLAGILLQFGLQIFTQLGQAPWLVAGMLLVYVVMKRWQPRYAILWVLVVGILIAMAQPGGVPWDRLQWQWPQLHWITPSWSWSALIGVGLPLFIVTMSAQNVPGAAVMQSFGYQLPLSPVLRFLGGLNMLVAPFGGFAINLAAITAAICANPQVDADPTRRYAAAVAAGVFYLCTGLGASVVVLLLTALPSAFVAALAGIALLGTIAAQGQQALAAETSREAALITMLAAASGVSLFGLAAPFWGLLLGLAVYHCWRK